MKPVLRFLGCVLLAVFVLQLYFAARIALMIWVDPQSTAFERSEIYRIGTEKNNFKWRQRWVPYSALSDNIKRAVIASEDASFVDHDGIEMEALEKAWEKNAKAEAASKAKNSKKNKSNKPAKQAKIIGGSTITQQLAKNLFLSGERTLPRKAQELVLTFMLEAMLDKQRILEIYLNSVEWGEGVFGAEAAAQRYWRKPASSLGPYEAAQLAVMLPRPKYFEPRFQSSGYLAARAATIVVRMYAVELPQ